MVGSGGLSHDPPLPTLATATEQVRERIVHGAPMSPEQRAARQDTVIAAARDFAAGRSTIAPLNPDFDQQFLDIVDNGSLADFDEWTNEYITNAGGNSAHEIRTWVAAFAAMAAAGAYRTGNRYYRAAPELIAGFATRTALPVEQR